MGGHTSDDTDDRRMLFTSCPARGAINMKVPSTSVLQDRFRLRAICYVGSVQCTATMVSCINISMSSQIYGPGPVHCDACWKSSSNFRSHETYQYQEVNVSRAGKFPIFPDYYF